MRESIDRDIGLQLHIQTEQEVLVERRREPQRIVIGEQQLLLWFHQIRAEQQIVTWTQRSANQPQERRRVRPVEVADIRAQHGDESRPRCFRRYPEEPILVSGVMRRHANARSVDGIERLHRVGQCRFRQIDQVGMDVSGVGLVQQRRQLLAIAASEFDDASTIPNRRPIVEPYRLSNRSSPRVTRYHDRWQIASNSAEPSAIVFSDAAHAAKRRTHIGMIWLEPLMTPAPGSR